MTIYNAGMFYSFLGRNARFEMPKTRIGIAVFKNGKIIAHDFFHYTDVKRSLL